MPFRERYLDHDALTRVLADWAAAHPHLVRVESLGTTPEGREIPLVTIGPEPDRARPTLLVNGNQHASELCGSSVALAIARAFLELHLTPEPELHGLPAHLLPSLREVRLQVVPRVSPDGAEKVLREGAYVRSVPRDPRPGRNRPRWIAHDLDGDGLAFLMRREDPLGELVESAAFPGLLVPREIEDAGPFYKVWPEGSLEGFDGHVVPDPGFLSDNFPDLNRNFPFDWRPEPEQAGAGDFPGSEPESRALIELATRSPHLFAWIDLHTFGGVFIRPLGDRPDSKLDPADLAVYRQLEQWAESLTGYPMVSGFEQFTYEPERPLRGDLTEYAYHQRACLTFVVELWDLFEQVGLPRPPRFVDRYTRLDRGDLEAIARWDRDHNGGRVVRPWRPFDHPQLGRVEIGGLDPRIGLWNPPEARLAEVCRGQVAMALRVAATAPRLELVDPRVEALGADLFRVSITVRNGGYLPTWVVAPGRTVPFEEPIVADATPIGGALVEPGAGRVVVGPLEGWGRGRHGGAGALYFQRSRGTSGERRVAWVVRGATGLRIRAGSCRTGTVERVVTVG